MSESRPPTHPEREQVIAIAPLLTELADEVLVLRCKYQNGEAIRHAVGTVRDALENLEDAMDKNAQEYFVRNR
jgi:hypothetical protein